VTVSAAGVSVNGEIYYECEHEPLSVSGPANIGCDSVVSGESPFHVPVHAFTSNP